MYNSVVEGLGGGSRGNGASRSLEGETVKLPAGSELQGLPARPRSWTACGWGPLRGKMWSDLGFGRTSGCRVGDELGASEP